MKYSYGTKIAFLAVLLVLATGHDAFAANKLGDVIARVNTSMRGLPSFLSFLSYIFGIFLAVAAIFKFKDHVDNASHTPVSAGVKRLISGGMFFSFPFMARVVRESMYGTNSRNIGIGNGVDTSQLTPGGLDSMIVNFISNIYGPSVAILTAFCYISGAALLMVAISRLTKKMEEGPRGPAGMGTLMTVIASGGLFSFGASAASFASSIFGDSTSLLSATVDQTLIQDATDRAKIEAVIGSLMAFMMLVGFIAFIRGWFVLKAFADGQSGATLAQGLTFLIGGSLAMNIGELVNILQNTVGIGGLTFS